jgi:hypothetical protein
MNLKSKKYLSIIKILKMFNNLVKNIHFNISKHTVLREKPTLLYISTFDKAFIPYKIIDNVEKYIPTPMKKIYPVNCQVDKVYYTYIESITGPGTRNNKIIPVQEQYIDIPLYSKDYLSKKEYPFASILDISYIDYNFQTFPLPTFDDEYIKFISESKINAVYKEFDSLIKYFKIKDVIHGYKITDSTYIFFDNDNKIIDINNFKESTDNQQKIK